MLATIVNKIKFLIIILLISVHSFGQKIFISTPNTVELFFGLDNPVEIAIENYSCKDLLLTCDDPKIIIKNYVCRCIIIPHIIGHAKFKIINHTNSKVIDSFDINIKQVPEPNFNFHYNGFDNMQLILDKFIAKNEVWDRFRSNYKIKEFEVIGKRDTVTIFDLKNMSANYSKEVKSNISKLLIGDKLYIGNIILQIGEIERNYYWGCYHKICSGDLK